MAKISQIIIGDELLNAKINDLNLQILAKEIAPLGFDFKKCTVLGDNFDQVTQEIKKQATENDFLIITGGLGPTKDDLTKSIVANALAVELVENLEAEKIAIKQYKAFGRVFSRESSNYHMLPKDTSPIYNPSGLAPGIHAKLGSCEIFCTPGVPRECEAMIRDSIVPMLKDRAQSAHELFVCRTHSIPEETIFFKLCPNLWKDLEEFGKVSSLPIISGVDITINLKPEFQNEESRQKIRDIIEATEIKNNIWTYGLRSIEEVIVEEAKTKGLTIGFAESCTGGLASSTITNVSGSSSVFLGGVVSYANSVKENIINVKEETLKNHGAVSIETATEMATGSRKALGVDIAISYTGIAGPGGATPGKPVGTVCIGVATSEGASAERYEFRGDRMRLKNKFCQQGLILLLAKVRDL
ncbi:competence/damage-inducible protein CinA [Bacteriovorax sp. BAL6_X]|uniref:CinA family nicotinamide mononucleotide deamidase-related protein n=1 Tax=Bacteriovorax sp. BAL6_X TaxID=1201290 RepID=UPI000385528C|nr:CinA family nicotinamide mononucleotide deamidase-related protein [Bacteriovorax sp. BAL6_X]EPZ51050.1 competence/damage-inducible protein CinA [Bacteriovorax sp. BAL6_X]